MQPNGPVLSVITPVFNGEQYVARSYECLRRQSFSDWEWVVVSDGSTDNTVRLLEELQDTRIRIIAYPDNRGRGYARTLALAECTGKWMVVWDIDDLYFPDRLARIADARLAGYEFVCSYAVLTDENLNITGCRGFSKAEHGIPRRFMHPSLACNVGLARDIGYPSFMRIAEDVLITMSLSAGHRGLFYEDALMAYQENYKDNAQKAIENTRGFFQCLQLARQRGLLTIDRSSMLLHRVRQCLKLSALYLVRLVPHAYAYTIRRRSSCCLSPAWHLSSDRIEFIGAAKDGRLGQEQAPHVVCELVAPTVEAPPTVPSPIAAFIPFGR